MPDTVGCLIVSLNLYNNLMSWMLLLLSCLQMRKWSLGEVTKLAKSHSASVLKRLDSRWARLWCSAGYMYSAFDSSVRLVGGVGKDYAGENRNGYPTPKEKLKYTAGWGRTMPYATHRA